MNQNYIFVLQNYEYNNNYFSLAPSHSQMDADILYYHQSSTLVPDNCTTEQCHSGRCQCYKEDERTLRDRDSWSHDEVIERGALYDFPVDCGQVGDQETDIETGYLERCVCYDSSHRGQWVVTQSYSSVSRLLLDGWTLNPTTSALHSPS